MRGKVREEAVGSEIDRQLGVADAAVLRHVPRMAHVILAYYWQAMRRAHLTHAYRLEQLAAHTAGRLGGRKGEQHRPLAVRAELVKLAVGRRPMLAGSAAGLVVGIGLKDLLQNRLELVGCLERAIAALLHKRRFNRVLMQQGGHMLPRERVTQRVQAVSLAFNLKRRPLDRSRRSRTRQLPIELLDERLPIGEAPACLAM